MWIYILISLGYILRIDSADAKISFLSTAKTKVFITSTFGFCPSFSRKMNKDFFFLTHDIPSNHSLSSCASSTFTD